MFHAASKPTERDDDGVVTPVMSKTVALHPEQQFPTAKCLDGARWSTFRTAWRWGDVDRYHVLGMELELLAAKGISPKKAPPDRLSGQPIVPSVGIQPFP